MHTVGYYSVHGVKCSKTTYYTYTQDDHDHGVALNEEPTVIIGHCDIFADLCRSKCSRIIGLSLSNFSCYACYCQYIDATGDSWYQIYTPYTDICVLVLDTTWRIVYAVSHLYFLLNCTDMAAIVRVWIIHQSLGLIRISSNVSSLSLSRWRWSDVNWWLFTINQRPCLSHLFTEIYWCP